VTHSKSRYYFTKLSAAEKEIYKQLLTGWSDLNKTISFDLPLSTSPDIPKIVEYIAMDNPGLFFINFGKIQFSRYRNNFTVEVKFHYEKKQIAEYDVKLRQEISKIMASYSVLGLSEYERVVSLHDCLAKNVEYEYDHHSETSHSVLGGLLKRKTVCEGFAKTFKLLCDGANIKCIVVSGTATPEGKASENHAWNIVKLGGDCYHIDVTWDSCAFKKTDMLSHAHLNLTDNDIAQDHEWKINLLPQCSTDKFNYFTFNKTHFATEEDFKEYFVKGLKNGQKSFEVKFENKPSDQVELSNIIQRIMQMRLTSLFLGYSYKLQYNATRGTAHIQMN
jgi:hypothetical protein